MSWGGGAATGLGFGVSFFQSAPENHVEGFESASLPPDFTTEGPSWTVVGPTPGSATSSARSGVIGDSGRTELHRVVHVRSSGSMFFARRVSSEFGFDFLSFHVDGIPVGATSGNAAWGFPSYMPITLPPGAHELVWVYEKDSLVSVGEDAAWIDAVLAPNLERAAPSGINAATPADATSQAWTVPNAPGSSYRIRVERLGIAPWLAFDESDGVFVIQAAPPPPPPPPAPPPPPPPVGPPPPPPPPVRPPAQARCIVPNVRGKTLAQARRLLTSRRCALGRVSRAYSGRVRKNKIISQSRRPGTRHPRRTRVNVLVSRGRRR